MAQSVLGKINYLTDAQYRKAKEEGNIDPNQIYLTPDDSDTKDYLNLEIGSVTTLPAGSQATAEITGTVTNPILNLGLPQGEKGATGDKGETGPTGPSPSTLDILKAVYPVGSVYIGVNTTNPNTLFGFGTWERLKGGYIYGANEGFSQSDLTGTATSNTSGTSGSYSGTSGSYSGTSGSTTLTADQSGLPSHQHVYSRFDYKSSGTDWGCKNSSSWGDTMVNMDSYTGNTGGTAAKSGHTHSIPSHTHSIPSHTHSMPSHSHNVPYIACVIWRRTA